ncbi:MAG: hypothetical protein AAF922_15925 [Pseudomonadota bacterium]
MGEFWKDWGECKCPFWPPALAWRNPQTNGDVEEFYSPRAGGRFIASGTLLASNSSDYRVALSKEIARRNILGQTPKLNTYEIQSLGTENSSSVSEQYDRFIAAVAHLYPRPGEPISAKSLWMGEKSWFIEAAFGSPTFVDGQVQKEIRLFCDEAVRRSHFFQDDPAGKQFRLSIQGHDYVRELGVSLNQSEQIFVAMWFGRDEQSKLYYEAIEPGIELAGYKSVRIDNTEHNAKIDDQIIAEIRKSKAVIVDLTCGLARPLDWSASEFVGAPRGGVFYEAGFAQGLGLPVIWTVKSDIADTENVVHFDVRQYNQIRWNEDLSEFRDRLRVRIEATLGRGPHT